MQHNCKAFGTRLQWVSALVITVFLLTVWVTRAQPTTQPTKLQWEYKIVDDGSDAPQEWNLKQSGDDGWELVAVAPPTEKSQMWHYVFKRPK